MSTWLAGTYTADMDGTAQGILALASRPDGTLEVTGLAAVADSPSYLLAAGDTVYAVAEAAGNVLAFTRSSEGLALVGTAPAAGDAPCHLGLYGSTLIVSNYVSGSLGVLDVAPLALVQRLDAAGNGPHRVQDGPHAHSTLQLADGRVLSADLGADRIHVHTLTGGSLARTASVQLPGGTGPRDIVQLASGDLLVLAELGGAILVLSTALEIRATVPIPGAVPGDHAAGISLWGDFVYVTLRGSNTIGVLRIVDGRLEPVATVSSEGNWPRHHAVDGSVLHVANQLSSTVASFELTDGGIPRLLAEPTPVASPTFLLRF
jgi:6-phosphogluconolactonase (cycloisomerase 2 family)